MTRKYLIVVDMQEDFVYGTLGTPEARNIVPVVVNMVKEFDGNVILTRDSHQSDYLETQEGKFLPVKHCISCSDGWNFIEPLEAMQMKSHFPTYAKETFGSVNLAVDLRAEHIKQEIESIEMIGVCTDICVISNALLLKAYLPEVPIIVHANGCAGVTPKKHEAALEVMRSCQIIVKG